MFKTFGFKAPRDPDKDKQERMDGWMLHLSNT